MTLQAFVSYSRKDQSYAERIRDALRSWGYATWIDIENIAHGTYWPDEIDKGLASSDVIIGIISPDAIESRNVRNEWDWALTYEKRLILLLLRPCTIPHRFVSINYIDLTRDENRALNDLRTTLTNPTPSQYREAVGMPSMESASKKNTHATSNRRPRDENRTRILQKVHDFWIVGVLENALRDNEFELGMVLQPDAVLKHVDYGDYQLPSTAGILKVFDDLESKLLILGAPGAGKTILMLQLARELIKRAEQDEMQAIPVVLNLSSWAEKCTSLADWLIERLWIEYRVTPKLARRWLENENLLLLLDGLDEVPEATRSSCVDAVNEFFIHYENVNSGICSRITEYLFLTKRLNLSSALTLQSLTDDQIVAHMDKPQFTTLRNALETSPYLREMAKTPFLFNTILFVYRGENTNHIKYMKDYGEIRKNLLRRYVKKRFDNNYNGKYNLAQLKEWLGWLAQKMRDHNKHPFYIEEIAPEFIAIKLQVYYSVITRFVSGWIFGGVIGIGSALFSQLADKFHLGLTLGLTIGLVSGLFIISNNQSGEKTRLLISSIIGLFIGSLLLINDSFVFVETIGGVVIGEILGLISSLIVYYLLLKYKKELSKGLNIWLAFETNHGNTFGPAVTLASGIVGVTSKAFMASFAGAVSAGIIGFVLSHAEARRPLIEDLSVNWLKIIKGLIIGMVIGVFIGYITGLFLSILLDFEYLYKFELAFGLSAGMAYGISLGLKGKEDTKVRTEPNRGIKVNIVKAIVVGVIFFFIFSTMFTVFFGFKEGILVGVYIGFASALLFGGLAVLQHAIIRVFITLPMRKSPLNYARFLDYCTSLHILRKVGGGYIFAHRMLLEYFAELEDDEKGEA